MLKRLALLSLAVALGACGSSDQAATGDVSPVPPLAVDESQLSVGDYTQQLAAIDLSQDADLSKVRDTWVTWYRQARIDRSVVRNGYVVDCVPFEHQPALLFASEAEKADARARMKTPSSIDFSRLDFDSQSQCPPGDVPVHRPRLSGFRNLNRRAHFKDVKPGGTPPTKAQNTGGYRYLYSPNKNVPGKTAASVLLDSGTGTATVPANGADHFLAQQWWCTDDDGDRTLECGITTCNYWTPTSTKTIFVFSTPDNYDSSEKAGKNAYKFNLYNLAGGFIQNPNTPALATPVGTVNYLFTYQKVTEGYEFLLTPVTDGSLGRPISMGYWPNSHYEGFADFPTAPDFRVLQSGFEVSTGGLPPVTAQPSDGTIQGYGAHMSGVRLTAADLFPVNGQQFTNSNPLQSSVMGVFGNLTLTPLGNVDTVSFSGRN